ncbi:nitroreductase/quinone reductase family protein [Kribbella catacumbae]|uniref:nitroreductase/quinone reductase family protein n=1 Tax=Kribbella catacumbae TaxID=460086 RepID=UPI00307C6CCB
MSFLFSQKAERTLNSFTQQIIEEFRANAGRVGGPFDGARLLLLTTTGARSGKPHTAVLGYYPDTSDRILIVGSAGGGPKHPDWYHNLLANPRVTVEDGLHTYQADAVVLRDAERDEIFDRLVEADPGWGKYQADTTRILPVVALTAATTGPPPATLTLRMIHDAFRHELTLIRKEVVTAASTGTTAGLGAQLRINCLKVCQGLHFHHTRESGGLFPALLATNPDLAGTIERLDQEHAQIATLLEELQTLLTNTSALDVLPRLDTLIEALNHHLDYEEDQLLPLLGQ